MNIFIGVSNDVNAITVKLSLDGPVNLALGLSSCAKRDLMINADFAYAFDERKGMWVWIKCRYRITDIASGLAKVDNDYVAMRSKSFVKVSPMFATMWENGTIFEI